VKLSVNGANFMKLTINKLLRCEHCLAIFHSCFSLNCAIMEIIGDLHHRNEQHIELNYLYLK